MCANIIKTIFLPKNNGCTFVLIPMIYGRCRHPRLSDYFASKTACKTGPCLRFLDIEQPNAPQHPISRITLQLDAKTAQKEKNKG